MIKETDLIVNSDGSIYHLGITPDQIGENIVLVGDPDRLKIFEKFFERIYFKHQNREFHSMMGDYRGKKIMVVSTGIGTDNIDIVINELDALANVDFKQKKVKAKKQKLKLIRMGTSGTIQEDIPVNAWVASAYSVGLDALMHFYATVENPNLLPLQNEVKKVLKKAGITSGCYCASSDSKLLKKSSAECLQGITVTLPGFYGPQARMVRADIRSDRFIDLFASVVFDGTRVTNFEMETSGIYGLANHLGHQPLSLSLILANRVRGEFSKNPQKHIQSLIEFGLSLF